MTQKEPDKLTFDIIGCAIEVNKELGPGLPESIYPKNKTICSMWLKKKHIDS